MKKTFRRIIYAICLGATSRFTRFVINPFIAPYLYELGFSESLISFMSSFGPLLLVFIIPVVGYIADKIGRKKTLIFGALLQITAISLFLLVESYPFVSIAVSALLLKVIGSYIFGLSILTLIQGWIDKRRGYLTGIHQSISSLGAFLGPLLGSYIVFIYSTKNVFTAALIIAIFLLIASFFVKERKDYKEEKVSIKDLNFFGVLSVFIKNKRLRAMGFLGFAFHLSEPAIVVFIPLFALNVLGVEISKVGLVTAALFALSLTQFISGRFSDKYGSGKIVILGSSIYAVALSSIFFVDSFGWLIFVALIMSLGSSIWNTSAWAYMYETAHKDDSGGQISGSYASFATLGQFVSYILSGFLLLILDLRLLFVFYSILLMAAILIVSKTIMRTKTGKNS